MVKRLFALCFIFILFTGNIHAFANSLPLDTAVNQNFKSKTYVGVSVRNHSTGELLYQVNGDVPRIPASNLKLLTAATALNVLGPEYRFKTELYTDGTLHENGVLDGNIYIKGTGDPTFLYKDFQNFARELKAVGVKRVNGYVLGDDTRFTGDMFPPGSVPHEQYEGYAAASTAITMSPNTNYNAGTIEFSVHASAPGWKPYFAAQPSFGGMTVENKAMTGKAGTRNTISVKRAAGSKKIVITGNIPAGSITRTTISMYNPTGSSLHAFTEAMKAQGITFSNQYLVAYRQVPSDAVLRSVKESMPLKEMVVHFMKKSINPMGDAFVKTMGYERYGVGDLSHGIKVMKEYGQTLGLSMDKWTIVDGSGLSAKNRVSPNELSLLVYKVKSEPSYAHFYKGYNVGGHVDKLKAGTLYNRFTAYNTRYHVLAKTGHISGVYTLTGLAQGFYSGKVYDFSVMTNYSSGTIKGIDNIVSEIVLKY